MMNEDYFLLQKLREGNMSALEVLYIRYVPQVKSFVSSILKDNADTEDFIQDLFLKIWEDRYIVCKAKSFKSYLYSMTRNMLYNKLKHGKVHQKYVGLEQKKTDYQDVETQILTKDILECIRNEMDNLSEKQRVIYELNRNDDMTYNEIADKMGISPKTVQYHISSVLAKLRRLL